MLSSKLKKQGMETKDSIHNSGNASGSRKLVSSSLSNAPEAMGGWGRQLNVVASRLWASDFW